MLKNEQGFIMVESMLALLLVMIMLTILISALQAQNISQKAKENLDIYEIYQAGTGIYDD